MRPVAIIQARLGSTRLPGKVLMPLLGRPMLWHVVQRVRDTPSIQEVVVATTTEARDQRVRDFCAEAGIACFAGSESDVLDRFYQAALRYTADPVIRITSDCPFVDPDVIERVIETYKRGGYDHVGVVTGAGAAFETQGRFPDGLDAECFSFAALERAWREATTPADREHVTPYIWREPGRFRIGAVRPEKDYSALRWTVDNADDFRVAEAVYQHLYAQDRVFGMQDILACLARHPEITAMNQAAIGHEGYEKLWRDTSVAATQPSNGQSDT